MLVFDKGNMNNDCDSSRPVTDASAPPTENVDREMDVDQTPGEHRVDIDVCVIPMGPMAETTETIGRNELS